MKYEKGKRAKCVKGRKTKDGGQMSQLPMANLQPPFATCHLPPAIRYVLFATCYSPRANTPYALRKPSTVYTTRSMFRRLASRAICGG